MDEMPERESPQFIQCLKSKPIVAEGASLMLRVGERMHLELPSYLERLWGELTGFKQGLFLIALLPKRPQNPRMFAKGGAVHVRALNRDFQLCGFHTSIIKFVTSPYPLVFLSFPDQYEKYHLRRSERVNCYLPASLLVDGKEFRATVINLSMGGARLALDPLGLDITPDQLIRQDAFLIASGRDPNKEMCIKLFILQAELNDELIMLRGEFSDYIGESRETLHESIAWMKKSMPLEPSPGS